jgi:hypothetical protein
MLIFFVVTQWHAPPQWSEPTPDARAACQVLLNAVNQRPQRALAIFNVRGTDLHFFFFFFFFFSSLTC